MIVASSPTPRSPWISLLAGAIGGAAALTAAAVVPAERARPLATGIPALLLLVGCGLYGARKWLFVTRLGSLHAWMVGHVALGAALLFAVLVHADLTDLGGTGWALVGLVVVQVASGLWAMVELSRAPRRFAKLTLGDAGLGPGFPTTVRRRLAVLDEGVRGVLGRRSTAVRDWFEARYRPVLDGRATELPALEGFPLADARAAEDLHARALEMAKLGAALAHLERAERASARWSWVHVPATVALVTLVVLHVIGWLVYG